MAEVFVAPGVNISGKGQEALAVLTAAAAAMSPNIASITVFSGHRGEGEANHNHNGGRGALDLQITSAVTGQPVYSYNNSSTNNSIRHSQNIAASAAYYASAAQTISDTAKAMGIGPSEIGLGINMMHLHLSPAANQAGYFNLNSVRQHQRPSPRP